MPEAASAEENELIANARRMLSVYEESEIMVRSGLYQPGASAEVDLAVALQPGLDAFAAERTNGGFSAAFARLAECLAGKADTEAGIAAQVDALHAQVCARMEELMEEALWLSAQRSAALGASAPL